MKLDPDGCRFGTWQGVGSVTATAMPVADSSVMTTDRAEDVPGRAHPDGHGRRRMPCQKTAPTAFFVVSLTAATLVVFASTVASGRHPHTPSSALAEVEPGSIRRRSTRRSRVPCRDQPQSPEVAVPVRAYLREPVLRIDVEPGTRPLRRRGLQRPGSGEGIAHSSSPRAADAAVRILRPVTGSANTVGVDVIAVPVDDESLAGRVEPRRSSTIVSTCFAVPSHPDARSGPDR